MAIREDEMDTDHGPTDMTRTTMPDTMKDLRFAILDLRVHFAEKRLLISA